MLSARRSAATSRTHGALSDTCTNVYVVNKELFNLLACTLVCPPTACCVASQHRTAAAMSRTHRQRSARSASGHGWRPHPGAAQTAAPARPQPHATGSCWAAGGQWGWRSSACTAIPLHPAVPGHTTVSHTKQAVHEAFSWPPHCLNALPPAHRGGWAI